MSETQQGTTEPKPGKVYRCTYCGTGPLTFNELGTHSRTCAARKDALAKQAAERPPPSPEEIYKGEPDANMVLEGILKNHPDIPSKVQEEIMSWAGLRGILDPQMVAYLLQNMRGVSSQTANIVAQKYSLALQKAQQEGKILVPFSLFPSSFVTTSTVPTSMGGPGVSSWPGLFTGGQPFMGRQPSIPGQYLTYEDFIKLMQEREERSRLQNLESRINKLDSDFAGALSKTKEDILSSIDSSKGGDYEEIKEYIDKDGKICDPEKALSMRIRRVPIARESTEIKSLREDVKALQKTIQDREISQLREEVREMKKKPEEGESRDVRELKDKLEETRKDYEGLKDKMESEERKRLENTIGKLDREIETLRGEVGKGEYREDTFRMLDTSVRELSKIVNSRRPLDTAKEILAPSGVSGSHPPSGEVSAEAQPNLEELRKKGLVVRLVERIRA